jgi:predicted amidohydrolase
MKTLHVAVAQIHSGGPLEETLKRIEKQVEAAAVVGAELILFSECALQGYGYESDLSAEIVAAQAVTIDSEPCNRVVEMAKRYGLTIVLGFFEEDSGKYYNTCLISYPDGRCDRQRKYHLTDTELAANISEGPLERTPVVVNDVKCAVIICSDTGNEDIRKFFSEQGFDYRLGPTAGGGALADMLHEEDLDTEAGRNKYVEERPNVFKAEAILDNSEWNGIGFASANALGPVGKRTCSQGHCMIVDNRGVMRAQIPGTTILEHQQDQMVHAELTFK